MKLLNKRGFILVETLIVSLFVATLFIVVYQNLVPSMGEYEAMTSYDDIDSIYASNLLKQSLLRYGNMDYIDSYLLNHPYLEITNCDDTNIYKNSEYCNKIKKSLNVSKDDYIFITNYNVSEFRKEVEKNEFFDSGKLSDFRNYMGTVTDTENFYQPDDENNDLIGKYRLFLTRTVTNADQTTSLKYVNIGIYTGKYKRYNMGEMVTFAPGDTTGDMNFYVLKNSPTNESLVTLILDRNLENGVSFGDVDHDIPPYIVLDRLKDLTEEWNHVVPFTSSDNYTYDTYTIDYDGYHARLLDSNDIYTIFGSKIDRDIFSQNSLFEIPFDVESLNYLSNELIGNQGYWMANMVAGNDEMAWTIQNQKISPAFIDELSNIGIRPVIVVSKDQLEG